METMTTYDDNNVGNVVNAAVFVYIAKNKRIKKKNKNKNNYAHQYIEFCMQFFVLCCCFF